MDPMMDREMVRWMLLASTAITAFIFGTLIGAWYTTNKFKKHMGTLVGQLTKKNLDKK